MAPIPEEGKDNKTPDRDEEEINHFSNPDLVTNLDINVADSSDDDNDDTPPAGYSLLPQEPGEGDGFESSDAEDNVGDMLPPINPSETVPDSILASEAGASAPTVSAATGNFHSTFLSKFPDGKVPAYMQVPAVPRDKDPHLWNQKREDGSVKFDKADDSAILKAMSGFSIPSENVPEWAKNLSDDQWKQQIVLRINTAGVRTCDKSQTVDADRPTHPHSSESSSDPHDASETNSK